MKRRLKTPVRIKLDFIKNLQSNSVDTKQLNFDEEPFTPLDQIVQPSFKPPPTPDTNYRKTLKRKREKNLQTSYLTFPQTTAEDNIDDEDVPNLKVRKTDLEDEDAGCSTPTSEDDSLHYDSPNTSLNENDVVKVPFTLNADTVHENIFSPHTKKHKSRKSQSNAPIIVGYFSRYLEDFEELDTIGTGAFGTVKKCINKWDGITYAIKKSTRPIRGEKDKELVLKEVHALACLRSRFIVGYYSSWIEDDHLFIQTEFCEGGSLNQRPFKSYTENELLKIIRQVATGLFHMHSLKIVHMDIKSENIYIKDGIYKIGDLGLVSSTLYDDNVLEGDARYVAPELFDFKKSEYLDRCDIFALGACIYELAIERELPSNGQEWQDIRNGKLRYLDNRSEDFVNLLKKMMERDPKKRPSALELLRMPILKRIAPTYEELEERVRELEDIIAFKSK